MTEASCKYWNKALLFFRVVLLNPWKGNKKWQIATSIVTKRKKWNERIHVTAWYNLVSYLFQRFSKINIMYWITNWVTYTYVTPHEQTLELVQTGEAIQRSSQTSFTNQQIIPISINIFPPPHLGFLKSFLFCMLVFKSRFFLCFFSKRSIIFSWRRKKKPYSISINFNL